jgi:hypothetical protein
MNSCVAASRTVLYQVMITPLKTWRGPPVHIFGLISNRRVEYTPAHPASAACASALLILDTEHDAAGKRNLGVESSIFDGG